MRQAIYILIFLPLNLFAQMGVGTSNPNAFLDIQTELAGRAALGITPQSNPIGTAAGQMAVIDNKLFLFDAVRNKWLSVEETILEFGRLGSGSAPSEIEFGGGDLQNGPRMPFNGTIVGVSMSATRDNNSREIGLFLNGIGVPNNNTISNKDGVFVLNPLTLKYNNTNYDLDFKSGDMLSLALLDPSVNDVDNLIVTLKVKWSKGTH